MAFKTCLYEASKNNIQGIKKLRDQQKKSFFLRWCSVLALLYHVQILWSLNLPILQSSILVPWSLGPLVLPSFGDSSALKHF